MIRFLLRFIGLLLLALAFIFVIYDGMKSIADRTFYATAINQFWIDIHGTSLQAFQAAVERQVGSRVWQIAIQPVLDQPAAAVFAALGVLLIVLGRKKRPLIGYARD
jgi:predicted lysophospholipase L1 biosynthesis ABC-type transport system permease subunit